MEKKKDYSDLITKIGKMTMLELNQFIKDLQTHFQIDLNVLTTGTGKKEAKEEAKKGLVDLLITEIGKSKIAVIKAVAKITGKGLLDAKKLLDSLPFTLVSQKPEEEIEKFKKEVEEAGATVKIK